MYVGAGGGGGGGLLRVGGGGGGDRSREGRGGQWTPSLHSPRLTVSFSGAVEGSLGEGDPNTGTGLQ